MHWEIRSLRGSWWWTRSVSLESRGSLCPLSQFFKDLYDTGISSSWNPVWLGDLPIEFLTCHGMVWRVCGIVLSSLGNRRLACDRFCLCVLWGPQSGFGLYANLEIGGKVVFSPNSI